MTDEQINAAIDKIKGFSGYDCRCESCHPDWCNDLNAMHDAENLLQRMKPEFARWLLEIVSRDAGPGVWYAAGSFAHVHATARQRAEAFLRTLGKWEEGE
jgi:hypothetical protein